MPVAPRIDYWRALRALLFTLVLPVVVAIALDVVTGLLPIVTIVAAVLCIPLATIVVNRVLLGEMDRILAMVAPEVEGEARSESEEQAGQENRAGEGIFQTND